MENVYVGNWSCLEDMLKDFCIDKSVVEGFEVLYAWYEYEDYSGSAFVLLKKGDTLYEVNGSHWSCYGLEEQFELEETNIEALLKRQHYGVNKEVVQGLVDRIEKM